MNNYARIGNGEDTMKKKVFIDGSSGTTGLRIFERFRVREDIELINIDEADRKNPQVKKELMNQADIVFLCLPDEAARESVSLIENEKIIVLDTSTAHRTNPDWVYGIPELNAGQREKIRQAKRIAVPGCYATGFISMCNPLIAGGIMPADYPVVTYAVSGYSGAGKNAIAQYESAGRDKELDAPRVYALTQQHKHLKEMQKITGLADTPIFTPMVCDYYSGMIVCLPLYTKLLKGRQNPETIHHYLTEYYKKQRFIGVMPFGTEAQTNGFLSGNSRSGWDGLDIYVTGNEERIQITACFDNLGKGASGAAIQCMNIVLGCNETKGLNL